MLWQKSPRYWHYRKRITLTDKSKSMDLLGTAVHDLKIPLASIKSFADLVRQSGALTDRQEHYLSRIQLAVENMTNLINDLLDLVWIEDGMQITKAPCNVIDVLRNQISAFEASAREKNVDVRLTYDDTVVPIQADDRRLRQAMGNLLSNSIKYNRPNGYIAIHVTRADQHLIVTFEDNGIGIAEKDLPHIFERFYRASRKSAERIEGSGLGLSIVQAIIERHNGLIEVESTLDKGSLFRISLPLE